jgi:hypothetical protein
MQMGDVKYGRIQIPLREKLLQTEPILPAKGATNKRPTVIVATAVQFPTCSPFAGPQCGDWSGNPHWARRHGLCHFRQTLLPHWKDILIPTHFYTIVTMQANHTIHDSLWE